MSRPRLVASIALAAGVLAGCGQHVNAGNGAVPTRTAPVIRTDIVARQQLPGSLTYADSYTVVNQSGPGVYTRVPAAGTVVTRGQVLYWVDDRPIPVFYGEPAWRRLAVGVADGRDVNRLQANLAALGYGAGLRVDDHYDWVTATAVRRWQAALGLLRTGAVEVGDAMYVPGPIRITSVQVAAGMTAHPGQPLLEGTSTQRAVLLSVDVARAALLKVGDQVTVTLADGKSTAAGAVTAIGTVATVGNYANGGGGPSGPAVAMVTVSIALTDPAAGGTLDQAPVNVAIAYDTHRGVLTVPVMALLAQPGGQYAVIVVDGTQRRQVTVATGLFDDRGLVEVTGADLREGMLVEIPQS